jgi:hypothetical protein
MNIRCLKILYKKLESRSKSDRKFSALSHPALKEPENFEMDILMVNFYIQVHLGKTFMSALFLSYVSTIQVECFKCSTRPCPPCV